jgi:hypothetical protein
MYNLQDMLNDKEYYTISLDKIEFSDDFISFRGESTGIGTCIKDLAPGAEDYLRSIQDNPKGYELICYGKMFMIVRGMAIANTAKPEDQPVMLYYRTKEQSKDYHSRQTYGSSAKEWLSRWDDKKSVWSIERGGFGPGYEQALQIAAVEWVRVLINELGDNTSDRSDHEELTNVIRGIYKSKDEEMMKTLSNLGLSGAQDGAAKQLAYMIYIKTPVRMFSEIRDMAESDKKPRMIQISNYFPTL